MDGRFEIAFVDGVYEDFRSPPYLQRRSRDRLLVSEHADAVASDLIANRSDAELELVSVRELDDVGPMCLFQTLSRGRELGRARVAV